MEKYCALMESKSFVGPQPTPSESLAKIEQNTEFLANKNQIWSSHVIINIIYLNYYSPAANDQKLVELFVLMIEV